jgi:hypothetical protein
LLVLFVGKGSTGKKEMNGWEVTETDVNPEALSWGWGISPERQQLPSTSGAMGIKPTTVKRTKQNKQTTATKILLHRLHP